MSSTPGGEDFNPDLEVYYRVPAPGSKEVNTVKENRTGEILGVLGGMGALASAEFLRTIYEQNIGRDEQDAPVVMVYSDPTFPDRTEAFLRGEAHLVHTPLVAALRRLSEIGASRFVLCCVTIHYLVPSLPAELKGRVISLLDTIFDSVQKAPRQKHLMICSTGTRRLRLLEEHERSAEAAGRIIFPNEQEQQTLHPMIYEIKNGNKLPEMKAYIESLLDKYEVSSFIAGCSEIHLLSKQFPPTGKSGGHYSCIDPLLIIAKELRGRKT
jgi:aspartate racemase